MMIALVAALVALILTVIARLVESRLRMRRVDGDQERQRQWNHRLVDASFDGLVIHRGGLILQINRALARMIGQRERELLGQNFATLAHPDMVAALRAELEAPQPQISTFTLLRADKKEVAVEISSQTIEHEHLPATVTAIRDISQRLADARMIDQLLHCDPLTEIANRKSFVAAIAAAIGRNDQQGGTTALFCIDIDQFKAVNEQIGRPAGDQILKQMVKRMGALTGESETLGRLSGDKFGIIVPGAGGATKASNLSSRLDATFNETFIVDGQLIKVSVSTGIAIYPDHAADADGLMKAADFALKQARRAGGGFSHMFSHEEANGFRAAAGREVFRAGMTETQRLSQDLRNALAASEIGLVYQPIFRTTDLMLVGFEALARWNHKKDGLIGPNVFIPLAEQAGLIHEIGSFVLETACAEAKLRAKNLTMAVNLSPLQFRDINLPERIAAILRKTGLEPARLELEVTESLLIDNNAAASQALLALRAIGVSLALDDFGTGYSSLSYLCDYPFGRLKIDKRFIQALGSDNNADAIVEAIMSLARNLRLEVTAEGVETEAQLAHLQKIGCPQVQGFLLGRPGPRAMVQNIALPSGQSLNLVNLTPSQMKARVN